MLRDNSGGAQAVEKRPLYYEIVAGERRWRAAKSIGLASVPVIVRDLDDRQMAEWGLIENLQREDLNPIDRARAFAHLIKLFGLSHGQIADRVGVDRSTVTNLLCLLVLDEPVRDLIADGKLSAGQGKALARVEDSDAQCELAKLTLERGWSVRQVEQAVRRWRYIEQGGDEPPPPTPAGQRGHIKALEETLAEQLQTRVRLRQGRQKGTGVLEINYYSLDHFDALLQRLRVKID